MKRLLLLAILLTAGQSWAVATQATLRVFCSGGMYPVIESLKEDYLQRTGTRLELEAAPSMGKTPQAIPNRLARQDNADVLVMVDYAIKPLERDNLVRAQSHKVLAHSLIAMAVKEGVTPPDISNVQKFKQALTEAPSIAISDSASGRYIRSEMLAKLGLSEKTAKKIFVVPATPVGQVVAEGKAAIGFQQHSELKAVKGIRIVGLIPQSVQQDTLYGAVMTQSSRQPEKALAFIDYLSSEKAKAAMTEKGLTPF